MSPPPPFPVDSPDTIQSRRDDDHIKLLAIFHFIGSGFAVLGLLFVAVHFLFMKSFFLNPDLWKNEKNPPPPMLMEILLWVYAFVAGYLVTCGILNLLSGLFLSRRQHRTFSLVVGGLNCLHIPIGTALGVFTIVVLSRDSVRKSYKS